jgi:hypothetical protein
MKIVGAVIINALLLCPLVSFAESSWRDMNGNAVPESATAKSKEGFSAALVMTPDKDWEQKWKTSPETILSFSEAKEVKIGKELFVLTFISNPLVDELGMTDVSCDFLVVRPSGTKSVHEVNKPCFNVKLTMNPTHVYHTTAWLKFTATRSDPRGIWKVSVRIRDNLRNVEIPLEASFLVK